MKLFDLPLALARRASDLLFQRDLQLRWKGVPSVRLVERGEAPTEADAGQAAERAGRELAEVQEQLSEVLDELPDIRDSVRHLVLVEQGLRTSGLATLYKLPLPVLEQALEQFEGLVTNWSPRGLATLRSKMSVTVRERVGEEDAGYVPRPGPSTATPRLQRTAGRMNAVVRPRPVGCGLSSTLPDR